MSECLLTSIHVLLDLNFKLLRQLIELLKVELIFGVEQGLLDVFGLILWLHRVEEVYEPQEWLRLPVCVVLEQDWDVFMVHIGVRALHSDHVDNSFHSLATDTDLVDIIVYANFLIPEEKREAPPVTRPASIGLHLRLHQPSATVFHASLVTQDS